MTAGPIFFVLLKVPKGPFEKQKQKIFFFKILEKLPKNAKKWPPFEARNGPMRILGAQVGVHHLKANKLGLRQEPAAFWNDPHRLRNWALKLG